MSDVRAAFKNLPVRFFLDSGAWSAFTQKVSINIDDYVKFIAENMSEFHIYANLDDMLNPQKSYDNLKYLESNGLNPLPVFHTGEDFTWLKKYADNYQYVCIGRIIPFTNQPKIIVPWMRKCMDILKHNTVHAFGVTNFNLIKLFDFDSFDSSSWTGAVRFGRLMLFDAMKKDFTGLMTSDRRELQKHFPLLQASGYDRFDFSFENAKKDHLKVAAVSAVSYRLFEQCLRRMGRDMNFYYAAVGHDIERLSEAFHYIEEKSGS